MSENSEHLRQLFESLGLTENNTLLNEVNDTYPDLQHFEECGERNFEEDRCDSFSLDDLDNFKNYGTTPPRTERNRKQKERNAYCTQAVEAAKACNSRNKRKSASRCASLPLSSANGAGTKANGNNKFRLRKRSQDLQRSYERQCKMQIEEVSPDVEAAAENDSSNIGNGSRSESLPPLCLAVKVVQRARYLSVSSRRIGSGKNISRKTSVADMPPDRVAFHSLMSGLLTNTPQDQTKSRSEEEVLYQQEINEMLWLELQAWHAGQDTLAYDNQLIENRKMVTQVYNEVMQFNFQNMYASKGEKLSSPCKMSCGECRFPSACGKPVLYEPCDLCFGCLSIWCENCREKESSALEHVCQLLERVSETRSLFPSSRKLIQFDPCWAEQEFKSRLRALCLWYNTTTQLRLVTDLLGRRLGHITSDSIPWPAFPSMKAYPKSPVSTYSRDSGNLSVEEPFDTGQRENSNPKRFTTPVVRFELDDSDEGITSSEPGQSYESDLTSGSNNSLNLVKTTNEVNSESDDGKSSLGDQLLIPPTFGLRRSSSDIFLQANPYRSYVENLLRNKGMKKTLDKVEEVIGDVMSRTICILQESHRLVKLKSDIHLLHADNNLSLVVPPLTALQEELRQVEAWTEKFDQLGLPRFHTLFLFLASIPMHMMRECLKLRLEQMPDKPSKLSIKQLMIEYKEAIRFSVCVRQKYVKWCSLLQMDLPHPLCVNVEDRRSQAIEELDSNVRRMLVVYLNWLDQFILMLHRQPNQSGLQRTFLQEEWQFVQSTCPFVTGVESLVASRFCTMACNMLCSVGNFLDTGLGDISISLENSFENDDAFLLESEEAFEIDEDDQDDKRKKLVQLCKAVQDLLTEARERALRAIAFAKMLRKDLEVAIHGSFSSLEEVLPCLREIGLILVKGHNAPDKLAFVPCHMKEIQEDIVDLFEMRFGSFDRDTCDAPPHHYLILISSGDSSNFSWQGETIDLSLTNDYGIAFSKIRPCECLLIAKNACNLGYIRSTLSHSLGSVGSFYPDYISPDGDVTNSLLDVKKEALEMCKHLEATIEEAQRLVSIEHGSTIGEEEYRQISHIVRDTVHQGYLLGFDYHKEVMRLVSGHLKESLAPLLSSFARSWIMFVKVHYSPGRGTRPRWALPGLEFLLFVCDPHVTSFLTDSEFKKLRLDIENAREFIIGSAGSSDSSAPSTPGGLGSRPFRHQVSHQSTNSDGGSSNFLDSPRIRNQLLKFSQKSLDRSHDEADESPIERVRHAIEELDSEIEDQRLNDKMIGRVTEYHRDPIEVKPHSVSFSWQRGFKIGTGRFAKVYTAVNNSNGELLAMKVLPLQPNDHRQIKKVSSELLTFERIRHPHLVKYYGVEVHKDEMRIFMEYCDEGTLEALASSTEGLPEEIVRKYTRQLMSAVHHLHSNGIVHRDIKGANIFLAKENNILKLGDFGCAVSLRGHHTEVGELSGIVGTHAFMAPEIFGSNSGHGRAADIWSSGCVVIEMVTGKRPWPQYDSSVQIMFQVGSGKFPTIPDSLSEEGQDFLSLCFVHNPKERATAAKLLDHTFVKVEDDESSSIPLFISSQSPLKGLFNLR